MGASKRHRGGARITPRPRGQAHETIDLGEWDEVYLVGDVHGCIDELRALLGRLGPAAEDLLVFVGDLVCKGPDSEAVVDLVQSRPNFRSVRGNNEHKLLCDLKELGLGEAPREHLETFPVSISFDDALVVHGGLDPRRPVDDQPDETLLTMRSVPPGHGYAGPFWFDQYVGPPRVFFGHTVVERPLVGPHAVALDTGCVYGGALTAYRYRDGSVVQVPARREYQPRPDAKIHSPP